MDNRDYRMLGNPCVDDMDARPQMQKCGLDLDLGEECQKPEHVQDAMVELNGPMEEENFVESNIPMKKKARKIGVPEVGMLFQSERHAFDFYNNYSQKVGFSVRKSKTRKTKTGAVRVRKYCCSKEGYRAEDRRRLFVKKPRPHTRIGCKAYMIITLQPDGKYCVTGFESKHNHELTSTSETHVLKSERALNVAQVAEADIANTNRSGLQPKPVVEFMNSKAGGHENLGILPFNYRNYLHSKRQKAMNKGDARDLLEYFQRKREGNPFFFYAIQVDEEDQMTNFFWADSKSVVDYSHFGDVVFFDMTYRTNKFGRPFGLFVGVNHHKQTVIFGAALLYDETTESFKWLFETFIKAMCGKKPKTILTDQDTTMANSIASVFQETQHRICIWHVYQNTLNRLSHIVDQVIDGLKPFAEDFKRCIYDHEEEQDFLSAWESMLKKYSLRQNMWLQKLFKEREKWALVYGRHAFCADMQSTQPSENMNCTLGYYLNSDLDMLQFLTHFDRVVEDQRSEELEAGFKMHLKNLNMYAPVQMLKQAISVYTPAVFEMFQKEYFLLMDCIAKKCGEVGTVIEYEVTMHGKPHKHTVKFDSLDNMVVCGCMKFEFIGILCKHALRVLDWHNIKELPPQYILKRWTKDAKGGTVRDNQEVTIQVEPKTAFARRINELCRVFGKFAARAAETEQGFAIALGYADKILQEVEESMKISTQKEPSIYASQGMSKSSVPSSYRESISSSSQLSQEFSVVGLNHHLFIGSSSRQEHEDGQDGDQQ